VFDSSDAAAQSFHAFPSWEMPQSEPWYNGAYGALGDLKIAS
jgi:hypothetical protein